MTEAAQRIDAIQSPRYAQLPTFMRLQHVAAPRDEDAVVIGAPYDGGTSYRPGARFGPRAIRAESVLMHGTGVDRGPSTFDLIRAVDGGDLDLTPFSMDIAIDQATRGLTALFADNRFVLMLGGDHSVTLAALRAAHAKHGKVAVLHLDAHSDTYPPVYGGQYHHGTPFMHAIEEGLVDPLRFVQIGLRGHTPNTSSMNYARDRGLTIFTADEFADRGVAEVSDVIRTTIGDAPVYVSVDVDVVDPAFAPGTGTPAPGGLLSREALALLRVVGDLHPVGADVMEVCPAYDQSAITAILAAEMGAELLHQYARSSQTGS
ncbi:agmatinase [Curtobacterium flaccumfaciens]|uniref:agmatinase n=1 Tax=Curtobacterium flaccumfaciens TaxID=2035 RepID=UPI0039A3DB64